MTTTTKAIPQAADRVTLPDIPGRLATLSAIPDLTDWEKTFVESIGSSFTRYGSLSQGQYKTMCEVELRNSTEKRAERIQWLEDWNEEKAKKFARMCRYYKNTSYFSGIIIALDKDPDWIPSRRDYEAVTENRWARKLLVLDAVPPKFKVGDFVLYEDWDGFRLAFVLEHEEYSRPAKGARPTKIFFVHSGRLNDELWLDEGNLRTPKPDLMERVKKDYDPF